MWITEFLLNSGMYMALISWTSAATRSPWHLREVDSSSTCGCLFNCRAYPALDWNQILPFTICWKKEQVCSILLRVYTRRKNTWWELNHYTITPYRLFNSEKEKNSLAHLLWCHTQYRGLRVISQTDVSFWSTLYTIVKCMSGIKCSRGWSGYNRQLLRLAYPESFIVREDMLQSVDSTYPVLSV